MGLSGVGVQASGTSAGLPKGVELRSLAVIRLSALTRSQDRALVASLQGLVAKRSPEQIFIDDGGASTVWKDYLASRYGITLTNEYATLPALVTHFRRYVRGYIVYDLATNRRSINVATSFSGPLMGLPVDRTQVELVRSLGITRELLDVSDKDEKWAYDNHRGLFSDATAAELNFTVYHQLRDYATLTNSFTFYGEVTDWRGRVLAGLAPGATLFGWGRNETAMVRQASQEGVATVPTDLAANLSALSSIHSTDGLRQKVDPAPVTRRKHYVSFVVSDGDNVQWNLRGLQQYYRNPDRGRFSIGYGVSPALVDLAPSVLRWYYENAGKERFIAGPSGGGYVYPSRMPADDLDRFTRNLNTSMGKAGLSIAEILDDQDSFDRPDVLSKYLRQPNIDALLYFGLNANGRIGWVDGKPVIGQRDVLWAGVTDEYALARAINARPVSPTTADGYTLVLVHCWTKSLSDIGRVVDGLGPDVEVVTPQDLVSLITQNRVGSA